MKEFNAWDLPETTKEEIIDKIDSLAMEIRLDYSDPRDECEKIMDLCKKLRELKESK